MFSKRYLILLIVLAFLLGCGQMKPGDVGDRDGSALVVIDESTLVGEMVSIPGGSFHMGDLSGDSESMNELPVHEVTIQPFRLGKYEVTFAQWGACVADGSCGGYRPHDEGWGRGNRPVINVSWNDAQSYIDWLNSRTSGGYRLPSEAEWEYAARAGSKTKYSWGNDIGRNRANCMYRPIHEPGCYDHWDYTAPVGSFAANAWGLHDMHGNVEEWVQDCWHVNYQGAPNDGSAWVSGCNLIDYNHSTSLRVLRGGFWIGYARHLRSAYRGSGYYRSNRTPKGGFRLAQNKQN